MLTVAIDFQKYHFYFLNNDGVGSEYVETESMSMNAAQILTLPCTEFEGVWENLYFDNDVKQQVNSLCREKKAGAFLVFRILTYFAIIIIIIIPRFAL